MLKCAFAVAIVVLVGSVNWVRAGSDLYAGYSHLNLEGNDKNLDGASGIDVGTTLSTPPAFDIPSLRLNLRVGLSYFKVDGNDTAEEPDNTQLYIAHLDFGPSWRHDFGNFFIEPGLAGILMLGHYDADSSNSQVSFTQWKGGYGFQPNIRIGTSWPGMEGGLQASYTWGRLKFGNSVGGDLNDFFIGGFIGWRW